MTDTQKHLAIQIERLADHLDARSDMSATARRVKDYGGAILFLVTLIAGGAVTFSELAAKPTKDEVAGSIEAHRTTEVHTLTREAIDRLPQVERKMDRLQRVQQYLIESALWRGDVLDHVARKRKGAPPPKPATLRRLETELLR